jgi:hypothetical protein
VTRTVTRVVLSTAKEGQALELNSGLVEASPLKKEVTLRKRVARQ